MAFQRPNTSPAGVAGSPALTTAVASRSAAGAAAHRPPQTQAMTAGASNSLFQFAAGGEEITITLEDIRNYFCPNATDKECVLFGQLCQANGLNPWLREAYLIKYDKNAAAAMVTGKDAYMRRANEHPEFDGLEAGVKVLVAETGDIEYREGAAFYPDLGEQLIGGWAKVYRRDRSRPAYEEVSLKEYDKGQSKWKDSPATMIRKVALVHALREAFPNNIRGMYDVDEVPYAADVEGDFSDMDEPQKPARRASGRRPARIEARAAATADPFVVQAEPAENIDIEADPLAPLEDGDPA